MRSTPFRRRGKPGFTLVELLVVIAIVLLASLVALPVVYSSLNGRQITDAARIFSGALVGARDSAIRFNEPRGIRLLPDPILTIPAPGFANSGTTQLCYNRIVPIEPAGDYSQGMVTIGPQLQPGQSQTGFPPAYSYPSMATGPAGVYLFPNSSSLPGVLMVEESPYAGGYVTALGEPRSPTNWYWNVRVGDKIKINASGRAYTIVGPCVINPWTSVVSNQGNPELFVNVGAPGSTPPLQRNYYTPAPAATPPVTPFATANPEFLFVVNGEDDDGDGYVDEGFDGANQNPPEPGNAPDATHDLLTDEPTEWEVETWKGALSEVRLLDIPPPLLASAATPSSTWAVTNFQNGAQDVPYIIERRPVPSQGAREVMLPAGMVIDATTWNTTRERSRLPIQSGSLYCDIMVNPNGLYVPTTQYSSPTSAGTLPFLHFWLTSREDVYPIGTIPASAGFSFNLPMTSTALGWDATNQVALPITSDGQYYPAATGLPVLKGDRRLVTMFTQSGLVTTNTIESIPPTAGVLAVGEGFCVGNVNYPFMRAQQGLREAR
jgi:prepilin-type N-terminal cleavage/methylation domain-containing protein